MIYAKINTDTNFLMTTDTPPDGTWFPLVDFATDSEGNYYDYYIDTDTPDQEKIDAVEQKHNQAIQDSMIEQGNLLRIGHDDRVRVNANGIIEDEVSHDVWMKSLYDNKDNDGAVSHAKPVSTERQMLSIFDEDLDPFVFTRYNDTWGWRWHMSLKRESVNALALSIKDKDGNYLYTTGALIADGQGGWYTECPAGQATTTPQDMYFEWLMGSAPISALEVYKGSKDTLEGYVHSDERYD